MNNFGVLVGYNYCVLESTIKILRIGDKMNEFDRRKFLKTGFLGIAGFLTIFSALKPFKLFSKFNGKRHEDSMFVPRDSKH